MAHTNTTPRPPKNKPRNWPEPQTTISTNPWPNLYVPQGPHAR